MISLCSLGHVTVLRAQSETGSSGTVPPSPVRFRSAILPRADLWADAAWTSLPRGGLLAQTEARDLSASEAMPSPSFATPPSPDSKLPDSPVTIPSPEAPEQLLMPPNLPPSKPKAPPKILSPDAVEPAETPELPGPKPTPAAEAAGAAPAPPASRPHYAGQGNFRFGFSEAPDNNPPWERPEELAPYAVSRQFRPLSDTLLSDVTFGQYPFRQDFNNPFFNRSAAYSKFRIGPVNFNFGVSVGASYNHTTAPGGRNNPSGFDVNSRILPGGDQNLGNGFQGILATSIGFYIGKSDNSPTIQGQYSASFRYPDLQDGNTGSGSRGSNTINQQLYFVARLPLDRWAFGLGVSFIDDNGPNRDVGGYANQTYISISPSATYLYSDKTNFEFNVNIPISEIADGRNSEQIYTSAFVNHKVDDRLTVGFGVVDGLSVSSGSQQNLGYQQALLRGRFFATPRLTVSATAGVQVGELSKSAQPEPIWNITAVYAPRIGTSFSLDTERTVQNNSFSGTANYNSTSVSIAMRQRLGNRMSLTLSGGYEHADYGVAGAGGVVRVDDLFTSEIGLDAQLGYRLFASLSYSYADNFSNTNPFRTSRAQLLFNFAF